MRFIQKLLIAAVAILPVQSFSQIDAQTLSTLRENGKVAEDRENSVRTDKERIAKAERLLEGEILQTAWQVFTELKNSGIKFKAAFRPSPNSECPAKVIESRAGGEFTVFRANCDTLYVEFSPVGGQDVILAPVQMIGAKGVRYAEVRYDKNCFFSIIGVDNKEYSCKGLLETTCKRKSALT